MYLDICGDPSCPYKKEVERLQQGRDLIIPDHVNTNIRVTRAQDIKAGDCFLFRGIKYLNLGGVTDERHTATHLFCLRDGGNVKNVSAITLFRTFTLSVFYHIPLSVELLSITKEEITKEMENDLRRLRS